MIIFSIIAFLSFVISIGSLIAIFILGVILGPALKKYDPDGYQGMYAFWIPSSAFLLLCYVRTSTNLDKFPPNKQWMIVTLKYLLPTALISGVLMFITGYVAFVD
jgi:hypothetical protein